MSEHVFVTFSCIIYAIGKSEIPLDIKQWVDEFLFYNTHVPIKQNAGRNHANLVFWTIAIHSMSKWDLNLIDIITTELEIF